jgi:hypothetical protein
MILVETRPLIVGIQPRSTTNTQQRQLRTSASQRKEWGLPEPAHLHRDSRNFILLNMGAVCQRCLNLAQHGAPLVAADTERSKQLSQTKTNKQTNKQTPTIMATKRLGEHQDSLLGQIM